MGLTYDHSHNSNTNTHGSAQLSFAVLINVILSIAQVIGGLISGSLSLIADALHNLSDAGAILVAIAARKIGNKAATSAMTYGYKRAEIIGVLINSTSLVLIGLYLIYEAAYRYFNPSPIDGWIVFWLAGLALIIDIATALLTYYAGAKESMNIRAAFIHNVSDAMASVAVIIAGLMIIHFQLYIVDIIITLGISAYVIYYGLVLLRKCILIIMQAVPDDIKVEDIKAALQALEGVEKVNYMHVWQLDEKNRFFEGHVALCSQEPEAIKDAIRSVLSQQFDISHSTIESHFHSKYKHVH